MILCDRLPTLPRLLAAVLALCLLGAGACDDGTAPVDRNLPDPDAEHGVVEGFAFRDATAPGGLRLHRTAEDGAGLEAATDAQVTVVGGGASGTTGPDGHFRVGPLAPGSVELVISDAGNERQIAVTVTADAVINVGETPVARDVAGDLALAEVGADETQPLWLLGPQQPLPAGTVIGQGLQAEDGASELTLEAPTWIFYLDDNPRARFHKAVRFILVDPESGAVSTRAATSWPTFNNYEFYWNGTVNRASPDLIRKPQWDAAPAIASGPSPVPDGARWPTPSALAVGQQGQTFGIIVHGDEREDFAVDAETTTQLVEGLGGTVYPYTPPRPGVTRDPLREIRDWFNQICTQAGPDDTIFMGFHTHGTARGSLEIDITAGDGTAPPETFLWHPAPYLPWQDCKAGRIIIWADVCFAGELVTRMETYVKSHPEIFGGKEVIVLGSSAADEWSGGEDRTPSKEILSPGGYYTNALIAALGDLSGGLDSEALIAAHETATRNVAALTAEDGDAPFISGGSRGLGQHPEFYARDLVPGETLHADGTVTQWGVRLDLGNGPTDVPLSRIEGYVIADPETPVTEAGGCEFIHLHAASEVGITVTLEDGSTVGPIPDPNPYFCGYGQILDLPYP